MNSFFIIRYYNVKKHVQLSTNPDFIKLISGLRKKRSKNLTDQR